MSEEIEPGCSFQLRTSSGTWQQTSEKGTDAGLNGCRERALLRAITEHGDGQWGETSHCGILLTYRYLTNN